MNEPRFITMRPAGLSASGKTRKWDLLSKASGALLGRIYWWPAWRQYVFEPNAEAVIIFEEDCLRDIASFVEVATRDHRSKARTDTQPKESS